MKNLSILVALGLFTFGSATLVKANEAEMIEDPAAIETIEEDAVIIEGNEELDAADAEIIDEVDSEKLEIEEAGEVGEAVEGLETEAAE